MKKLTKLLIFSIVLLIIGASLNWFSAKYIEQTFELKKVDDLFFYHFEFKDLSMITEILTMFSYLMIIIFVVNKKLYNYLPFFIFIIAIFQFLRAGMIILTPLASPYGDLKFGILYKLLPNVGMFPSGHVAVPLLGCLFAWNTKGINYKVLFLALFIIMSTFMLLSRGHYSIDIIATIFICYSIVVFSQKHLQKYLVINYDSNI